MEQGIQNEVATLEVGALIGNVGIKDLEEWLGTPSRTL
ncbi:hypothetical protein PYCH_01990 [Pyrococcus yayanosii CH1]|uniref:Uncharacterized protein n=1 Tax=Pyrococcus yayanosii (strain CH1 / JCM 16557) TaxID=529709 RepID=F8AG65_PYRYC|nr:hypothetical protein [Pyrococcus yayanosii]AEH23901.1 hypothetical protein PYCH_01990 [Pyrococcus yayanosii CH1]